MIMIHEPGAWGVLPRSFRTIHATVCVASDKSTVNELVAQNRGSACSWVDASGGITLGSAAVRRKPNAFNLAYQMRLLERVGKNAESDLKAAGCEVLACVLAGVAGLRGDHASLHGRQA